MHLAIYPYFLSISQCCILPTYVFLFLCISLFPLHIPKPISSFIIWLQSINLQVILLDKVQYRPYSCDYSQLLWFLLIASTSHSNAVIHSKSERLIRSSFATEDRSTTLLWANQHITDLQYSSALYTQFVFMYPGWETSWEETTLYHTLTASSNSHLILNAYLCLRVCCVYQIFPYIYIIMPACDCVEAFVHVCVSL